MTVLDARETAFEQAFVHDEEIRFKMLSHRNKLFGRWAAEQLGLKEGAAESYAKQIVEELCEPSDGMTTPDDKVVSKVVFDLEAAGSTLTPDEVRGVLWEFQDQAKANLRPTVAAR